MNQQVNQYVIAAANAVARKLLKQISFPSPLRALVEIGMFVSVFVASGMTSLGLGFSHMLTPMVPVILVIMLANVASGVYRRDITTSIMNIYLHSAYGFLLSSIGFLLTIGLFYPAYADTKFFFFFLFSAFFVSNTVRPLISGTDFMDGGGRRTN